MAIIDHAVGYYYYFLFMGKLSKIALILIKLFNTGTARTAKPGVGNMKNKLIYESMMTSKPKQCNLVPTILFPEFTLFSFSSEIDDFTADHDN